MTKSHRVLSGVKFRDNKIETFNLLLLHNFKTHHIHICFSYLRFFDF